MSVISAGPWLAFREEENSGGARHSDERFWDCAFSRRNFVRAAAGVTGWMFASRLVPAGFIPGVALADNDSRVGMPPCDFADTFYGQNGVIPAHISKRLDRTCPA